MVQRRKRGRQIGHVPQHPPGVLLAQLGHAIDEPLEPDTRPGDVAPQLLVGGQVLGEVEVGLGVPEVCGTGQLGQRLVKRLAGALGDVENRHRPGDGDLRDVSDGPDQLTQLGHQRVAAGQGAAGVGQRDGAHDVGL